MRDAGMIRFALFVLLATALLQCEAVQAANQPGTVIWSKELPGIEAGWLAPDGTWLVLVRKGQIEAYLADGTSLWMRKEAVPIPRPLRAELGWRVVAFADSERVMVGTRQGYLECIGKDGQVLWKKKLPGTPIEVRVAADKSAVAVAVDQKSKAEVRVFSPMGREIWTIPVNSLFHFDLGSGGKMLAVAEETSEGGVAMVYRLQGEATRLLSIKHINTEEGDIFVRFSPDETRVAVLPVPSEKVAIFSVGGKLLLKQDIYVNGWGEPKVLEFHQQSLLVAGMDDVGPVLLSIDDKGNMIRIPFFDTKKKDARDVVGAQPLANGDLLVLVAYVNFMQHYHRVEMVKVSAAGSVTQFFQEDGEPVGIEVDSTGSRALLLTDRGVRLFQL